MELDEFISGTLSQIIKGVKHAQGQYGKLVNPLPGQGERFKDVEFDVAVTVEENTGKGGKAKISVMGSSMGGGASANTIERSSTKIKFSVPLLYGTSND